MSAKAAFLTRLSRVADEPVSNVARSAAARALVDAYKYSLYERLEIVGLRQPTTHAKQAGMDALDELRLVVLGAELGAEPSAARMFVIARQRIEMARRALDLCTAEGERASQPDIREDAGSSDAPRDDRAFIDAMQYRLRDRHAIDASWEAIRKSRALLMRFGASSLP